MGPMSAEEAGIVAIVFLQHIRGIDEPVEKARKGWRDMDAVSKRSTMRAYNMMAWANGPPVELENGDLQVPFGTFNVVVPRKRPS